MLSSASRSRRSPSAPPPPHTAAAERSASAPRSPGSLRRAGLTVTVLDYDDRLELDNETGKPLVILGYQGEPYLAFRDGRVYRNTRSPATYLNDDRFGQVSLPSRPTRKLPPAWEEVDRARIRLARPPHPLDEPDAPAEGPGRQGQAAPCLRLDRSRHARRKAARSPARSTTSRLRTGSQTPLIIVLILLSSLV